jgi:hypothetical protein
MTFTTLRRALFLATFAAACAAPAYADSVASSASSAGSASSASISDSIGSSSNSSNRDRDRRVTAGDYRVIDIAQAPAKADTTRLTLRPVGGDLAQEFTLDVPNRALAARAVGAGALVHVNERVYGYEFAYADTRQPFFLALQDDWYRELGSRKVTI